MSKVFSMRQHSAAPRRRYQTKYPPENWARCYISFRRVRLNRGVGLKREKGLMEIMERNGGRD